MSLFSAFARSIHHLSTNLIAATQINSPLHTNQLLQCLNRNIESTQVRTRIRYNLFGESETMQEVPDRFFRLYNGLWIRSRAGKSKRLWKKSLRRVHRLRQHVVCNKSQCIRLDKMVNLEYKVPHAYVNDPYEIYHRKSNLPDYRFKPKKFYP